MSGLRAACRRLAAFLGVLSTWPWPFTVGPAFAMPIPVPTTNPNPPPPIPFPIPPPQPSPIDIWDILFWIAVIIVVLVILAIILGPLLLRLIRKVLERLFCYPRLVNFTAVRTRVLVHSQGGACWLDFGPYPTAAGIEFTATVTLPRPNCAGTLQFVQDLVTHRERTPGTATGSPKECITTNGKRVLDTTDPYHQMPVAGVGPHTITTDDSPGAALNPCEMFSADDRFRMFLMWKPAGLLGRLGFRLPVAKIEWWWKGTAEATTPTTADCSEGPGLNWRLTSPPTDHGDNGPGAWTLRWPVTSPNIRDIVRAGWKKC